MIPYSLIVRIVVAAAIALVIAIVFGLLVRSCAAPAGQQAAQATVNAAQSQGHQKGAEDAVAVVVNQTGNETSEDAQTRENHDKIVAAPGAQAPVDPGVNDAGILALCLRRAYRSTERCVHLLNPDPAGVAKAGSGR